MKIDKQPAFPIFNENGYASENNRGLTKREYFAAVALQGLLAAPGEWTFDSVVRSAVSYADAVLIELEKTATRETP